MSSSDGSQGGQKVAEVLYAASLSSEPSQEPPSSQWSSLQLEAPVANRKRLLAAAGLYDPGEAELCTAYLAASDSAVLRHPYYSYPAVLDPGIEQALFGPDPVKVYEEDGQQRYLDLCEEMGMCPVRPFHLGLLRDHIDLRYYGVNPAGVRAMCLALARNKTVQSVDLTDNWLTDDGAYHLGRLLVENSTLTELNLHGCRIGPEGVRRLCDTLPYNRTLKVLNLAFNQIGDQGVEKLGEIMSESATIERLNLSHNNLTVKSAQALSAAFEYNNKLTHLDLSWNSLFAPATTGLLNRLGTSVKLVELNLAWNALCGARIAGGIRNLMKIPTFQRLDISNNKFCAEAINPITAWWWKAKKLNTVDLSFNPLSPDDAYKVLSKMTNVKVKLQKLYMNNIWVNKDFLELLDSVKKMKSRRSFELTYGGVARNYEVNGPDYRELILRRCDFIARKPKKRPMDIALYLMALHKANPNPIGPRDLSALAAEAGIALDDDLLDEMANAFPGPKNAKGMRLVNLDGVVDYVKRMWPDTKLPPTPPPTPPPEPEPPKTGKGKGKGKKK